ncbi:hypothetical protein K505DRAFT_307801 [Melanomma pulvis-pyrius CBS 109.77]|uniref:MYND-type domain-containing protein n=1 Tax=Melanomma pulvis-pyrius CBS 109.77 TaxID=1314802 RepID=A0A6A6X7S4_9PLEO|nr:hypothetical protein K505DRAFT_307801 [Melanomma pulvis-pyrius CBS 109.77]
MEKVPIVPPACANQTPKTICPTIGSLSCANCKLVLYCSQDCQKAHWQEHKKTCKSALSKAKWRPAWDRENRHPPWANGQAAVNIHNPFGGGKYLWGNVPAFDVLKLKENEGEGYAEDVALLFAASGDLRNVVKTLANLPNLYRNAVLITLNDREFEVVARNAILLLFVLTSLEDPQRSITGIAESVIHIWYSALLPANLLSSLQSEVKPLIAAVCAKIAKRAPDAVLGKTWTFASGSTLRLSLRQQEWLRLERFSDVPTGFGVEEAKKVRAAIVLAPERMDYRERWYYKDTNPFMRLSKQRFREDGLLLPFGHPRMGFDVPNPTFFQTSNVWPLGDQADPLSGWSIADVVETPSLAANDWYGKLFIHLRDEFSKFLERLRLVKINFTLLNVDAKELPIYLDRNTYARIEVSNITDSYYLGTRQTLALFSPFLQPPSQNPHATLIALYLNAISQIMKTGREGEGLPNTKVLMQYIPLNFENMILSQQGADSYRAETTSRHMTGEGFKQIEKESHVAVKIPSTIIEPWPTALKLRPGQEGAQEEFDLLVASNFSGIERYVEWKKVV